MNCPHCKKEIKPKPQKSIPIKMWQKDDIEFIVGAQTTKLITKNHPGINKKLFKARNRQKAAQAINDCMVKHGYEIAELLKICEWVCKHPFWKKQFQAVPKLARNDNGSTGITLVWIDRFKLEMNNDLTMLTGKSVSSINEAFSFEEKE